MLTSTRSVFMFAILIVATFTAGASQQDKKKKEPQPKDEKILFALEQRCRKMETFQIEVLFETKILQKVIEKSKDKKPSATEKEAALKLAVRQKAIVGEADKCIELLRKEGTAVAFPEVFEQLKKDMVLVQQRLEKCDLGKKTQEIEVDIIETLREMTMALKK